MYGFRFVESESVTITCRALVCPISMASSCKQECVDTITVTVVERRRRNAIETSAHSEKSASVSFRVGTIINTNKATGLKPNAVIFPFVLLLLIIWVERHAFL